MEWRTVVLPDVSRLLGTCGLSRAGLLQVLPFLHVDLPTRVASLRSNRNPADDRQFICRCELFDADGWHDFAFLVDDTTAPGRLFVIDVNHQHRPFGG